MPNEVGCLAVRKSTDLLELLSLWWTPAAVLRGVCGGGGVGGAFAEISRCCLISPPNDTRLLALSLPTSAGCELQCSSGAGRCFIWLSLIGLLYAASWPYARVVDEAFEATDASRAFARLRSVTEGGDNEDCRCGNSVKRSSLDNGLIGLSVRFSLNAVALGKLSELWEPMVVNKGSVSDLCMTLFLVGFKVDLEAELSIVLS